MNFFRKLKRWYNHSEILAKELSKLTWIEYNDKILKRVKNTKQQSKLTKKEREKNLVWVFWFNKKYEKYLEYKKVILVDDVVSTWSTINEVSRILKENWALKVVGLCVASD
jgi:ComF family protein